eukprot:1159831-Pelagomonas_calceolata.AAC.4
MSLHDWALNRARAAEAAKAEAEGRGADAQRSRGGGITILAPPSAPNRDHEAYRETHVQEVQTRNCYSCCWLLWWQQMKVNDQLNLMPCQCPGTYIVRNFHGGYDGAARLCAGSVKLRASNPLACAFWAKNDVPGGADVSA